MKRFEHHVCAGSLVMLATCVVLYPPVAPDRHPAESLRVAPRPAAVALRDAEKQGRPLPSNPPARTWRQPRTPGAAPGFDLFTPPRVMADPVTRRLTLMRERGPGADPDAGLELLQVVREPYRLQLIGFAGDGANCAGVFENRISGRTFLARAPSELPELDLQLQSLRVTREYTAIAGATALAQPVAVAEVLDLASGERVRLSSIELSTSGPWRAQLRERGSGRLHEVSAGREFMIGEVAYRVEAMSEQPPGVQVLRLEAGADPESRWLRPAP